jgi:glycogen debranching enzyme
MISERNLRQLEDNAIALLRENRRSGHSDLHRLDYSYTCPSPGRYPYQWFWDSCFHAVTLSHFDPEWAQKELLSLVAVQREDGFLPHVIFWQRGSPHHYWKYLQASGALNPKWTAYIQPPVLAIAALRVFKATSDSGFACRILPALRRFHEWLRSSRDPDGDGLISIVSPFESGMDWSPQFDTLFRGGLAARWHGPRLLDLRHRLTGHETPSMLSRFDVEEVATNSIWYEAQRSLAALAREVHDEEISDREEQAAARTQESILAECWDKEASSFFSLVSTRHRLRSRTVASVTPLLLDDLSSEQVAALIDDIQQPRGFGTEFPLPSVAVREGTFRPKPGIFLWRGASWMNMNWLVVTGLLKHGFVDLAQKLTEASAQAISRSGFRECYQPYDGEGMGAQNFGWSTLIVDMLRATR